MEKIRVGIHVPQLSYNIAMYAAGRKRTVTLEDFAYYFGTNDDRQDIEDALRCLISFDLVKEISDVWNSPIVVTPRCRVWLFG